MTGQAWLAGAALALAAGSAQANDTARVEAQAADAYPTRPITIVVTFAPGGGTDLLARKLALVMQQRWGQPVVVENRPGASGNIGASRVAKAAADGYTLLMVNSTFAINPGVYGPLDFSPGRDFDTVINVGFVPSVLVVPSNSPWHGLDDLLATARGASQTPFFASCGAGTPQHLAGEMLRMQAHAPLQQIAYKGCGPALTDVMSGQVGLGIVTASAAAPLLASGKLRALAVTSRERIAQLPDVPSVAEQGLPGYELDQWHGLLAPAGTPAGIIARVNGLLADAIAQPELKTGLEQMGYTLTRGDERSPRAFQRLLNRDLQRFGTITARMGLRLD